MKCFSFRGLSPWFLKFVVLFGAFKAYAKPEFESLKKPDQTPEQTSLILQAGSGFGVFQDIQLPDSTTAGLRADGKLHGEEHANHLGTPLYLNLGFTFPKVLGSLQWNLESQFLTMRAISGPPETQSSSYNRVNLSSGLSYHWLVFGWQAGLSGRGILRRSSFNNVSNGHYVHAGILEGGLFLTNPDFLVAASLGLSPYAELGYSSGRSIFGEKLKSAQLALKEYRLEIAHALSSSVWLELNMDQEMIATHHARGLDYAGLGLSINKRASGDRSFELVTTICRVGFRKLF